MSELSPPAGSVDKTVLLRSGHYTLLTLQPRKFEAILDVDAGDRATAHDADVLPKVNLPLRILSQVLFLSGRMYSKNRC